MKLNQIMGLTTQTEKVEHLEHISSHPTLRLAGSSPSRSILTLFLASSYPKGFQVPNSRFKVQV